MFDTNVLVSALITQGKTRLLFDQAVEGKILLLTSQEILSEFTKITARASIRKYVKEADVTIFLDLI